MAGGALYLGLLVYGAGVLVLSFLGVLGQEHDEGGAESDAGHDGDVHQTEAQDHGSDGDGHAASRSDGAVAAYDRAGAEPARDRSPQTGLKAASRIASLLRSSVFLAFGAGATGLFAGFSGLGALEGAAWALGGGVLVLAVSRVVRRLVRRDLDSSFKNEEFLMEEALVTIPVAPGQIGKAELRKFGADVELYVRASDPARSLAKGDIVRIVDYAEGCYYVEPVMDRTAQ